MNRTLVTSGLHCKELYVCRLTLLVAGLVNELVSFLEGGHNWRSDSAVKSTWAIANLLADAPTVQVG